MSITAANATISITVATIFPNGFNLTRFDTDDIYSSGNIRKNVTKMGVDGFQSAGKVWVSKPVTYHFQPDSPSCAFFDQWAAAEDQLNDTLAASGLTVLTGLQQKFTMINGTLGECSPLPQAGQTLKARSFEIIWQNIINAPYVGIG